MSKYIIQFLTIREYAMDAAGPLLALHEVVDTRLSSSELGSIVYQRVLGPDGREALGWMTFDYRQPDALVTLGLKPGEEIRSLGAVEG
jgi:hypothetical protein